MNKHPQAKNVVSNLTHLHTTACNNYFSFLHLTYHIGRKYTLTSFTTLPISKTPSLQISLVISVIKPLPQHIVDKISLSSYFILHKGHSSPFKILKLILPLDHLEFLVFNILFHENKLLDIHLIR